MEMWVGLINPCFIALECCAPEEVEPYKEYLRGKGYKDSEIVETASSPQELFSSLAKEITP